MTFDAIPMRSPFVWVGGQLMIGLGTSRSWTLDILAPEITTVCCVLNPVVARLVSIARLKAGDRLIFVVHIFHRASLQ